MYFHSPISCSRPSPFCIKYTWGLLDQATSWWDVASLLPHLGFFLPVVKCSDTREGYWRAQAYLIHQHLLASQTCLWILKAVPITLEESAITLRNECGADLKLQFEASIWQLATLHLEMAELETSNSRLTVMNLSPVSSFRHPSGWRSTIAGWLEK